jgi:mannose-6-phosphate isomerase-like protein (cupin superfamily)
MKPITHLDDLKAKYAGQTNWREKIIDDGNSLAYMIQEAPGSKYARRMFADSPAWWVVVEGRVRFEIEQGGGGFETVEATKGSYVFVPERMVHSLEVIGDEPAIRFEVTLYSATPVFDEKPSVAPGASIEYIPVRLSTGPNPLDVPDLDGKPWPSHVNVYQLAEENADRKNWSREATACAATSFAAKPLRAMARPPQATADTCTPTSPNSGSSCSANSAGSSKATSPQPFTASPAT